MSPRTSVAALALALLCAACARKPEPPVQHPVAHADTVALITRTLHHETADCRAGEAPCLELDLSYPILLSVPDGDTLVLNRDLRRRLNTGTVSNETPIESDPDSLLRAKISAFEAPLPTGAPWYEQTTARLEHWTPGLLTLSIQQSAYTGGAHPNTQTVYLVLDPRTAAGVALDSVLVPGARPRLIARVESAFRRVRGLAADSSFADAGFWFKDRFELTPNWALMPSGLRFHYNAYEVGPYSLGPTTADVPWSELLGIVRPAYLPR
jgi:hypothetical protein